MFRALVPLLALVPAAATQDRPAEVSPEQQLRLKLDSPFLRRADWTTDYDVARERAAAADGKLILGYFTTAGY